MKAVLVGLLSCLSFLALTAGEHRFAPQFYDSHYNKENCAFSCDGISTFEKTNHCNRLMKKLDLAIQSGNVDLFEELLKQNDMTCDRCMTFIYRILNFANNKDRKCTVSMLKKIFEVIQNYHLSIQKEQIQALLCKHPLIMIDLLQAKHWIVDGITEHMVLSVRTNAASQLDQKGSDAIVEILSGHDQSSHIAGGEQIDISQDRVNGSPTDKDGRNSGARKRVQKQLTFDERDTKRSKKIAANNASKPMGMVRASENNQGLTASKNREETSIEKPLQLQTEQTTVYASNVTNMCDHVTQNNVNNTLNLSPLLGSASLVCGWGIWLLNSFSKSVTKKNDNMLVCFEEIKDNNESLPLGVPC